MRAYDSYTPVSTNMAGWRISMFSWKCMLKKIVDFSLPCEKRSKP